MPLVNRPVVIDKQKCGAERDEQGVLRMTFNNNHKNNKKGQLAVFIIIGMIMLVMAGVYFIGSKVSEEGSAESRLEKFASERVQAASVEYYVTSCLGNSLERGLDIIGKQGGYILKDHPSSILPFDLPYVKFDVFDKTYQVTYRIEKNRLGTLPSYPCLTADNPPVFCKFAANKDEFTDLPKLTYGSARPLFLYNESSFFSVENALNAFVEYETLNCINFSRFIAFNITTGNMSVKTNIQDSGVTSTIHFPVIIEVQGEVPVFEKLVFSSDKKIKLKQLHQAVSEVLSYDNSDLDFRIKEDTLQGKFKDRKMMVKDINFQINVIPNVKKFDDLIQVIDMDSKVGGKNYYYQFVRQNRPPALDFIKGNVEDAVKFDFVLLPGQMLELSPLGHDPDEDMLGYDFTAVDPNDQRAVAIAKALKDDSLELGDKPPACFRRCGSYKTMPYDTGYHEIKVSVTDGEYTDYQIIRIRISSLLTAVASGRNTYLQFDNKQATLEDPYILDASSSIGILPGIKYIYKWSDLDENLKWQTGIPGGVVTPNCLLIQTEQDCDTLSDYDIKDKGESYFTKTGQHNITLSVAYQVTPEEQPQASSDILSVNVTECFPLRSSYPAYPYLNSTSLIGIIDNPLTQQLTKQNLFFGNHTCCGDNSKIAASGKCFEFNFGPTCAPTQPGQADITRLLGVMPVVDDETVPYSGALPLVAAEIPPQSFAEDALSDIYTIKFSQQCGKRGNACSGPISYQWKQVKDCHPQCQMPCSTNFNPDCSKEQCPFRPSDVSVNLEMEPTAGCVNTDKDKTFNSQFLQKTKMVGSFDMETFCDGFSNSGNRCYEDSSGGLIISDITPAGTTSSFRCKITCDGFGGCNKIVKIS